MKYFPIFIKTENQRIILAGGGETALAKLRLLLKSEAKIEVFAEEADAQILAWDAEGRLGYYPERLRPKHLHGARLLYAACESREENTYVKELGSSAGILVNVVDTPEECDFITPALVDRDPLVIAIGTEGAAPVLARQIKAKLEAELSPELGKILRVAQKFRRRVENFSSKRRRIFWSTFYDRVTNPQFNEPDTVQNLLEEIAVNPYKHEGYVSFVGAGPGDPELLTLKARKKIDAADVILHDRLVSPEILELARREAVVIEVGKKGFGPSWSQSDINNLMIEHALQGASVVRLKSGDPVIYGRLDEETEALQNANIKYDVIPGISAANAAAASLKVSLTRRERNSEFRFLTGHDLKGFAEHDWRALARPGACAAIYMGAKQATQLRGRLLMHGALAETPVLAIENVSRPDEHVVATNLLKFPDAIEDAKPEGPVVLLYGIELKDAQQARAQIEIELKEVAL